MQDRGCFVMLPTQRRATCSCFSNWSSILVVILGAEFLDRAFCVQPSFTGPRLTVVGRRYPCFLTEDVAAQST